MVGVLIVIINLCSLDCDFIANIDCLPFDDFN